MMFRCFSLLIFLSLAPTAPAVEEFRAPEAHPVERYIPLWNKNPFTLKTAPAAIQRDSFAKDLALAGITRIGADTTVLLVNTKTRDYLRLKNEELHASGMKVKSVNMKETRSESSVEVIMGSETSVLKFDNGFLAQMVPQQAPAPGMVPGGNNGVVPMPVLPGSPQAPPGMGNPINQDGRPYPSNAPGQVNGSPMTTPPQMIPTVPTRRVRTAPVSRPNPTVPDP